MRKDNLNSKRGAAVLDRDDRDGALKDFYRPSAAAPQRVLAGAGRPTPIEFPEETDAESSGAGQFLRNQRRAFVRKSWIPQSKLGRILLGAGALFALGAAAAALMMVRGFLLHDPRFRIESSSSIHILGNSHVTRPELLGIFGEDIGRNMFYVPMAQRRADLEALPWVERATVMRLLPDRLRVSVIERTPVAFVRQGSHIGLVDAHGVLLEMAADSPSHPQQHYSFPVVVGISAAEPLSTREARMKIFERFRNELDATGEHISQQLSEVDLSEPEDVRALVFDKDADILVHFGDVDFLDRYHSFQSHLPEWRQQYPKLGSVDMRYPRQVVLEMQPGSAVPVADAATAVNQTSAVPAAGTESSAAQPAQAAKASTAAVNSLAAKAAAIKAPSPAKASVPNNSAALPKVSTPLVKMSSVKPLLPANRALPAPQPASKTTPQAEQKAVQLNAQAGDPLQAADARLGRKAAERAKANASAHAKAKGPDRKAVAAIPSAAIATTDSSTTSEKFDWTPKPAGRSTPGKHSAAHPVPTTRQPAGQAP